VSAPVFTIRRKASAVFTLDEYERQGIMSASQRGAIEAAVTRRQNILVVGGTGTGKTTLANAIIDQMVRAAPQHRLVIIEDTSELQCAADNAVSLRATDTVDMQRLLKATMRLRPDRIIVGSVANSERQRSSPVPTMKVSSPTNRTAAPGTGVPRPSTDLCGSCA